MGDVALGLLAMLGLMGGIGLFTVLAGVNDFEDTDGLRVPTTIGCDEE